MYTQRPVYSKVRRRASRSTASKGGAGLARQVEWAGVEPLEGGVQDGHLPPEAALGRGLCGLDLGYKGVRVRVRVGVRVRFKVRVRARVRVRVG